MLSRRRLALRITWTARFRQRNFCIQQSDALWASNGGRVILNNSSYRRNAQVCVLDTQRVALFSSFRSHVGLPNAKVNQVLCYPEPRFCWLICFSCFVSIALRLCLILRVSTSFAPPCFVNVATFRHRVFNWDLVCWTPAICRLKSNFQVHSKISFAKMARSAS